MAFRIDIAGADRAFPCTASQSILEAARNAGIELPHSCMQGVCGNCAGRIMQGSTAGTSASNELCGPGEVLFCMTKPATDLVIRPRSWRLSDPSVPKRVRLKVYRNTRVSADVSVLQLRLPAGQRVKFRAGQFLKVLVDSRHARQYSMANPPHESDSVVLHVRHVPGGLFTAKLPSLAAGDVLEAELPFGQFCVPDDDRRPLVFVATGTGFAPVKSIIDDMLKRGLGRPITLIWGARSPEGLYLPGAVETWKARSPGFRFIPAISGSAGPPLPDAFGGRVDGALGEHFPSLKGHALYCCGSAEMIRSVFARAMQCGLEPADFHADAFARTTTLQWEGE